VVNSILEAGILGQQGLDGLVMEFLFILMTSLESFPNGIVNLSQIWLRQRVEVAPRPLTNQWIMFMQIVCFGSDFR